MKTTWKTLVCMAALAAPAMAEEWADLKIQIKIDGKAPEQKAIKADKDAAVCAAKPLFEENYVVGADGGLRDVMVWLVPADGAKVNVHPDVQKAAMDTPVVLDNVACKFIGHGAVMSVGQKLILKNSDAVGHNTKIDFQANKPINPILPANSEQDVGVIAKVEKRPTPISCSIHPWMTASLMVAPTPYNGVTNEEGMVEIKNLPVGEYTFKFWHASIGNVAKVTDGAGKAVEWKKGETKFKLVAGANDQGTFKVAPSKK